MRITRGETFAAYPWASGENADAVKMIPFEALAPWSTPTKPCTTGLPTFALPPFRLDADEIESKPVFADDAVDAAISASAAD